MDSPDKLRSIDLAKLKRVRIYLRISVQSSWSSLGVAVDRHKGIDQTLTANKVNLLCFPSPSIWLTTQSDPLAVGLPYPEDWGWREREDPQKIGLFHRGEIILLVKLLTWVRGWVTSVQILEQDNPKSYPSGTGNKGWHLYTWEVKITDRIYLPPGSSGSQCVSAGEYASGWSNWAGWLMIEGGKAVIEGNEAWSEDRYTHTHTHTIIFFMIEEYWET